MATQTLEAMAAALEASGHYRILRRLDVANACSSRVDGAETRIGCVVDVETSGLNVASDEIIQLAIMPFRYTTKDARVVEVLRDFCGYRQPSRPISRAITELTGIDDAMVLGRRIDPNDVAAFMAQHAVDFAVAHNMKFDREFLQRAFPEAFTNCRWLCSLHQVPWSSEAFRGRGLAFLAQQAGWFCRSHDAGEDRRTLLALLNHPLRVTGRTPLSYLLAELGKDVRAGLSAVAAARIRIRAIGAPFEHKELLKARGYRWCPGTNGDPKAWFTEIDDADRDAEIAFLSREVLGDRGRALVEAVAAT